MTLSELDNYRADKMRELLNEEGQRQIWGYDISPRKQAFRMALEDYDFDNIQRDGESKAEYVLTGPGICDHPFTTTAELDNILEWLCNDSGYLGCYAREQG